MLVPRLAHQAMSSYSHQLFIQNHQAARASLHLTAYLDRTLTIAKLIHGL